MVMATHILFTMKSLGERVITLSHSDSKMGVTAAEVTG